MIVQLQSVCRQPAFNSSLITSHILTNAQTDHHQTDEKSITKDSEHQGVSAYNSSLSYAITHYVAFHCILILLNQVMRLIRCIFRRGILHKEPWE